MGLWLTLIIWAVTFVLSELLRPKPNIEDARPANLGDFSFPTATEGRHVPIVFGTVRIDGPNVVWYGDLQQIAITEKIKTGMFSSSTVIRGFNYRIGIQFAFSRGIDELRRVWIGEDEIFNGVAVHGTAIAIDQPELFGGDDLGNGGVVGTLRLFAGTPTQAASTYLSPFQAQGGDTPAYRDTAYAVWEGGTIGNSTTIKPWRFEVRRISGNLGALPADQIVNGNDSNILAIAYEMMTNDEWGFGFPAADIDFSNFQAAATVLRIEGNGFSFTMDRQMEASDFLKELERQMDGVFFLDAASGQWKVNLARNDYVLATIPKIDATNLVEIVSFDRSAWEDTTNHVRVNFSNRALDYKTTFGLAQDMANVRIQGGANISVTENYPGVKDAALATSIAWRELRTLSYPLFKAALIVDRSFWNTVQADVFAWTDPQLGFVDQPVRVTRVDLGELQKNRVRLDVVQDIFQFSAGSFAPPPATGWLPPSDTLVAFPVDQQLAFEAPLAFVTRNPLGVGTTTKLWCGARRQGPEVSFRIRERNSALLPTGTFQIAGEVFDLMVVGELFANLNAGSTQPSTLTVVPTPDTQADIRNAFEATLLEDVGTNLRFLIMVNGEFMFVAGGAVDNLLNVNLLSVYRAALDSVEGDHLAGDKVYLLFVGGGMTDTDFASTNNVHIRLTPRSLTDELPDTSANQISLVMADRVERPYPPSDVSLNTVRFAASTSLEGNAASGQDAEGIDTLLNRRDFRTVDEIAALLNDAASLFPDFPAANTTVHELDVRNDPAGADTFLFTTAAISGQTIDVLRKTILRFTNGVLPIALRFVIRSRHTVAAGVFDSRYDLVWDFNVTSALSGDFNFGATSINVVSNLYTATTPGTYNFTIGAAFAVGAVQYRINGGGFLALIAAGLTTGAIVGVVATDTIEIRHTSTDVGAETLITMVAGGGGNNAYGVLFT